MNAIVIGAGIGGLTAALSLHAAGIRCRVYESAAEIRPLGVGINVLPHATKELEDLGLLPALEAAGVITREVVYVTRRGHVIWSEPRGRFAGYRWPQVSIHRGTLQMLLYDAVRERLGADAVLADHRAVGVTQSAGGATVHFRRRAAGEAALDASADVVIAADGIHSAIRAGFYPDEGPPKWGGMILWRGTSVARPFLSGATMMIAGNAKTKFVCYPIRSLDDGRQLINWIADVAVDQSGMKSAADWNRRGSREAFLPHYRDWSHAVVDIPALVGAAEEIFEYPMSDRDPVPRWSFGRVTLLGDAAHALYPIGSNGAAQAMLDARRLALELATRPSVEAALAAYEDARRPAMEKLLYAHRAEGADVVLDLLEERAPNGFEDLEKVLPYREREEVALRYKKMAGFDMKLLNESPPMKVNPAA
ncbi:MAG TPA: flavin-dependent oxidoreductase [Burkholderiales bacterium]|nr:flavin-dependent oxidoreductase [Burkholderiales bacterium]